MGCAELRARWGNTDARLGVPVGASMTAVEHDTARVRLKSSMWRCRIATGRQCGTRPSWCEAIIGQPAVHRVMDLLAENRKRIPGVLWHGMAVYSAEQRVE